MAKSAHGFHTTLGGFQKRDVIAYIEKTASQHRLELLKYEREISELKAENRSLSQQLNLLMMANSAPSPFSAPDAVSSPDPIPVFEVEPVEVDAGDDSELKQKELEAYRRAEALERHVTVKAKELYEEMEGLCSGTLNDFQTADEAVNQAIEVMTAQAAALEQTYQTLTAAFQTCLEKLSALNKGYSGPEETEETEETE